MAERRNGRRHEVEVGPGDAGERLDRLFAARFPELSRSRVKALIEAGCVSAGGATISEPSRRVKPGQTFAIIIPEAAPAVPAAQTIPLDILYEDADIIVVNKPPGMAVHPGPGSPDLTLVNALIAHCGKSLSGIGGVTRPGIVHRLDKGTSGLIVAAKNDHAHQTLSRAFAARAIDRAYQAVVWGRPAPSSGEISGAIGRHPTNRRKMAVLKQGGKPALTRYRVLRALGPAASLVECRLATGRTHQIRVHMASIGHPVVGDPLYGRVSPARLAMLGEAGRAALVRLGRQALHAYRLGFAHPRTGEPCLWEAPLPSDLKELIRTLERI